MSTEGARAREKQAWRTLKEFLEKAEDAVQKEVRRATPSVRRSLESSLDSASRLFASTIKALDKHTEREQADVLKAYKMLLDAQSGFVESRLRTLERKGPPSKD